MAEQVTGDRVYAEQVAPALPAVTARVPRNPDQFQHPRLCSVGNRVEHPAGRLAVRHVPGDRGALPAVPRVPAAQIRPTRRRALWARRFVIGAGAAGAAVGDRRLGALSGVLAAAPVPGDLPDRRHDAGWPWWSWRRCAQAFLAFMLPASIPLIAATVFAQGTTLHIFMGVLMVVLLGVMLGTMPVLARDDARVAAREVRERGAGRAAVAGQPRALRAHRARSSSAEEVLRQTEQKFEALIEASPISIMARDSDLRIVKWNALPSACYGWTGAGSAGPSRCPPLPPDREDEAKAMRAATAAGRTAQRSRNGAPCARTARASTSASRRRSCAMPRDSPTRFYQPCHRHHRAQARRAAAADGALRHARYWRNRARWRRRCRRCCAPSAKRAAGFTVPRWELDKAANLLHCAETWCVDASPGCDEFEAFNRARTQTPGASKGADTPGVGPATPRCGSRTWRKTAACGGGRRRSRPGCIRLSLFRSWSVRSSTASSNCSGARCGSPTRR